MEELKRCPFCGGEGVLQRTITFPVAFFVYCRNCPIETPIFVDEDKAFEFWNTRD